MRFSVGFVIAALALSSTATPVQQSKGLPVSLSRRAVQNADGTANLGAIRGNVNNALGKIEAGFANYLKNTGKVHPLAPKNSSKKRATGADALTAQGADLWYGTLSIGSPAVEFKIDFDTGSSDIFVPGANCDSTCDGHTKYDPSASSTSKDKGATFTLTYGDGSTVNGEQYTDTVTVAGLTATGQTVGAATQYTTGFSYPTFLPDGLAGMGFSTISSYGSDPVWQTLYDQKQLDDAVFGFKLNKNGGSELYLGGVNTDLYKGDFTTVNVLPAGYWQVEFDGVSVNGNSVLGSQNGIIDTGTTLVIGPTASIEKFYAAIPGAKNATDVGAGYYSFPCDSTLPPISMTFGGKEFAVSADSFNYGEISDGVCMGGFAGSDAFGFWIVGDVFLQNVYTKFDAGTPVPIIGAIGATVGFADLA